MYAESKKREKKSLRNSVLSVIYSNRLQFNENAL